MGNFKHASLFSGIGACDIAADKMGWENIFHCELNPFGRDILKFYWPNAISYEDITKTDFSIHRGTIDVLTGGFPCQPYSQAGLRKGTEDERHLWPEMRRAIREIEPPWVVGENVLGLVNWNGGLVFEEVQADLEAEGYEVQPYVLPAAGVDAPHQRYRVWFVAYSQSNRDRRRLRSMESQNGSIREPKEYGENNDQFGNNGTQRITPNTASDRRKRKGARSQVENRQKESRKPGQLEGRYEGLCSTCTSSDPDNEERNRWSGIGEQKREAPELRRDGVFRPVARPGKVGAFTNADSGTGRTICGHEACSWRKATEHTFNSNTSSIGFTADSNGFGLRGETNRIRESRFFNEASEGDYWANFPTQPPVRDGNDGFPTELLRQRIREDSMGYLSEKEINKILSEADTQWRNESIKAGGNAIVPQVVHQIFKAIEQYETNHLKPSGV